MDLYISVNRNIIAPPDSVRDSASWGACPSQIRA